MDLPAHLRDTPYDRMQVTLVDCPGHASLIRTIIGGAQIIGTCTAQAHSTQPPPHHTHTLSIHPYPPYPSPHIDMMMLVIDVGKGIQTQTAECLVIGEITNESLIVVLNKLDVLPLETREADLERMRGRIQKTLSTTKFADAPMVGVAARPGGNPDDAAAAAAAAEEAAMDGEAVTTPPSSSSTAPVGINELLSLISQRVTLPQRDPDGPLLFAIDHCFPIKGQGTVMTGTVLSGSMKVGMEIDFPELKQQRKIKSMQMFKKPVMAVHQGDRVGVCVTQLDAKAMERGGSHARMAM